VAVIRISTLLLKSQDSAIIAIGYGLDDRSSSPGWVKNSLISMSSRAALRSTQPPIKWVPGAVSRE
jgi:hypothetical protein